VGFELTWDYAQRILGNVSEVLTSFYYALPSSIYRGFSRQSKLRIAWYEHISPSSSPHFLRSWRPEHHLRRSKRLNAFRSISKVVSGKTDLEGSPKSNPSRNDESCVRELAGASRKVIQATTRQRAEPTCEAVSKFDVRVLFARRKMFTPSDCC
jgi:hypothetical protein